MVRQQRDLPSELRWLGPRVLLVRAPLLFVGGASIRAGFADPVC
jgi:hypothetical protein